MLQYGQGLQEQLTCFHELSVLLDTQPHTPRIYSDGLGIDGGHHFRMRVVQLAS